MGISGDEYKPSLGFIIEGEGGSVGLSVFLLFVSQKCNQFHTKSHAYRIYCPYRFILPNRRFETALMETKRRAKTRKRYRFNTKRIKI